MKGQPPHSPSGPSYHLTPEGRIPSSSPVSHVEILHFLLWHKEAAIGNGKLYVGIVITFHFHQFQQVFFKNDILPVSSGPATRQLKG